jgi:hypothetical protein
MNHPSTSDTERLTPARQCTIKLVFLNVSSIKSAA